MRLGDTHWNYIAALSLYPVVLQIFPTTFQPDKDQEGNAINHNRLITANTHKCRCIQTITNTQTHTRLQAQRPNRNPPSTSIKPNQITIYGLAEPIRLNISTSVILAERRIQCIQCIYEWVSVCDMCGFIVCMCVWCVFSGRQTSYEYIWLICFSLLFCCYMKRWIIIRCFRSSVIPTIYTHISLKSKGQAIKAKWL